MKKGEFADVIKEPKMGQLSWIIWVNPIYNHKCLCKRDAGHVTTDRKWSCVF